MALSNIFREPQREITESVVGIVLLTAFIFAGYLFCLWIGCKRWEDFVLGGALWLLVVGAVWLFITVTHDIGDEVCNALQRANIHLRPRNRK
jgi:hypothetical protein